MSVLSVPQAQAKEEPLAHDPFFKRGRGATWNACIGKQGNEENYLDGYIEAAQELVAAVIDKKLLAKRDTLVLPILYNARHAVELALKFANERLHKIGAIKTAPRRNHNIRLAWDALDQADIGDEKLRRCIAALGPFVASLCHIDSDGQELRYHLNRSDDPSLSRYSLANLKIIRASLDELATIVSDLKYRTVSFVDEQATGTFTSRCSRRDLMAIATLMPRMNRWRNPVFDVQKALVKERFNLSNRQFSKALDVIKNHREMNAKLGAQSKLAHLSDCTIIWIIDQWRKLHPRRSEEEDGAMDDFDIEAMKERLSLAREVVDAVANRLSPDELADLEAIFYLGRDGWFSEYYDSYVEEVKARHTVANEPKEKVYHLIEKTNLLNEVRRGVTKLGRLWLAHFLLHL